MRPARAYLDLVATIAMIVTSGVLVWFAVSNHTPSRSPAAGYSQGDAFGPIEGLTFNDTPATAVLFVQSTCKFCAASMPFYRRLSALPHRARFVVLGVESPEELQAYVTSQQLRVDKIVSVSAQSVKFRGTPTMLLVDHKGVVREVWPGMLDKAREETVLKKIGL